MKDISEATAPAEIHKQMLEVDLQGQCARWYRGRADDAWARKFSSISQRSVPDYLFGRVLFGSRIKFATEFKRPGTKLTEKKDGTMSMSTEAQHEEQKAMRLAGWFVFEADLFDKFKATVLAYENEQT